MSDQTSEFDKKVVKLMRLVDGDVTASERAQMLLEAADDPEAQEIMAQMDATGRKIAAPFAFFAKAPIPQRLVDSIMHAKSEQAPETFRPAARQPERRASNMADWVLEWLTPLRMAGLAASLLVVGVGVAALLRGGGVPGPLAATNIKIVEGHGEADGLLKRALETARSGQPVPASNVGEIPGKALVVLTFKSKQTIYCRQYEVDEPGSVRYGGIACREAGGGWIVRDHRPVRVLPSQDDKVITSSNPRDVFRPILDDMAAAPPLGSKGEEELLLRRWQE